MLRKLEKAMMGILNEENSNNKDVILERSTSSSSSKKKSSSKRSRSKSKTKKRSIKASNELPSPSTRTTKIKKKSKGSNNEDIDSTTGHESTYTATTVNMESFSKSMNLSFHGEDSDLPFFSLESPVSQVRKCDMSSTSFQTASPSSHSSATSLALESYQNDNDNHNKATEDASKDAIPSTPKSSSTKKKKKSLKKLTSSSSSSPSSKTMKRVASEGNLKSKSEKEAVDKGGYNSDTAMSKKVEKKKKKMRSTQQQDSASVGTNTSSSKASTRSASDSAMSKKKKKIKKKKNSIQPIDLETYLEGCNSSSDSQLLSKSSTELSSTTSKTDNVKKDDTVSKKAPKTGEVKKDNKVSSSLDQEQKKVTKSPKKSKKDKVKKGKDEIKEGNKKDNAIKKHTNSNKRPSLESDHEAADVDQSNESKDVVQTLDSDKGTKLDNPTPKAKPSKSPIKSKPKHRHSSSDIVSSSIGPLEKKIRASSDRNLSIDGLLSPRTMIAQQPESRMSFIGSSSLSQLDVPLVNPKGEGCSDDENDEDNNKNATHLPTSCNHGNQESHQVNKGVRENIRELARLKAQKARAKAEEKKKEEAKQLEAKQKYFEERMLREKEILAEKEAQRLRIEAEEKEWQRQKDEEQRLREEKAQRIREAGAQERDMISQVHREKSCGDSSSKLIIDAREEAKRLLERTTSVQKLQTDPKLQTDTTNSQQRIQEAKAARYEEFQTIMKKLNKLNAMLDDLYEDIGSREKAKSTNKYSKYMKKKDEYVKKLGEFEEYKDIFNRSLAEHDRQEQEKIRAENARIRNEQEQMRLEEEIRLEKERIRLEGEQNAAAEEVQREQILANEQKEGEESDAAVDERAKHEKEAIQKQRQPEEKHRLVDEKREGSTQPQKDPPVEKKLEEHHIIQESIKCEKDAMLPEKLQEQEQEQERFEEEVERQSQDAIQRQKAEYEQDRQRLESIKRIKAEKKCLKDKPLIEEGKAQRPNLKDRLNALKEERIVKKKAAAEDAERLQRERIAKEKAEEQARLETLEEERAAKEKQIEEKCIAAEKTAAEEAARLEEERIAKEEQLEEDIKKAKEEDDRLPSEEVTQIKAEKDARTIKWEQQEARFKAQAEVRRLESLERARTELEKQRARILNNNFNGKQAKEDGNQIQEVVQPQVEEARHLESLERAQTELEKQRDRILNKHSNGKQAKGDGSQIQEVVQPQFEEARHLESLERAWTELEKQRARILNKHSNGKQAKEGGNQSQEVVHPQFEGYGKAEPETEIKDFGSKLQFWGGSKAGLRDESAGAELEKQDGNQIQEVVHHRFEEGLDKAEPENEFIDFGSKLHFWGGSKAGLRVKHKQLNHDDLIVQEEVSDDACYIEGSMDDDNEYYFEEILEDEIIEEIIEDAYEYEFFEEIIEFEDHDLTDEEKAEEIVEQEFYDELVVEDYEDDHDHGFVEELLVVEVDDDLSYDEETINDEEMSYEEETVEDEEAIVDDEMSYDEETVEDEKSVEDEVVIEDHASVTDELSYDEETVEDEESMEYDAMSYEEETIEDEEGIDYDDMSYDEETVEDEKSVEEDVVIQGHASDKLTEFELVKEELRAAKKELMERGKQEPEQRIPSEVEIKQQHEADAKKTQETNASTSRRCLEILSDLKEEAYKFSVPTRVVEDPPGHVADVEMAVEEESVSSEESSSYFEEEILDDHEYFEEELALDYCKDCDDQSWEELSVTSDSSRSYEELVISEEEYHGFPSHPSLGSFLHTIEEEHEEGYDYDMHRHDKSALSAVDIEIEDGSETWFGSRLGEEEEIEIAAGNDDGSLFGDIDCDSEIVEIVEDDEDYGEDNMLLDLVEVIDEEGNVVEILETFEENDEVDELDELSYIEEEIIPKFEVPVLPVLDVWQKKEQEDQSMAIENGEQKEYPEVAPRTPRNIMMAIMAAAQHDFKLRKVPVDHKRKFVSIASSAAALGRLTRLEEHTLVAQGRGTVALQNKHKFDSWKPSGAPIQMLRSVNTTLCNEAAAMGRMLRLKEVVVTNYADNDISGLKKFFNDEEKEAAIDDIVDEKGARIFRTDLLVHRHIRDHHNEIITQGFSERALEEASWTVDGVSVANVQLPTPKAPQFRPTKTKLSMDEIMESISRGVAENAWERKYRLERPQAQLRVTNLCRCKYCEKPNPFQTHAYKQMNQQEQQKRGR